MERTKLACLVAAGLLLGVIVSAGRTSAQDDPEMPPVKDEKAKTAGTLKPRPETDVEAATWVGKLGSPKPQPLSVDKGPILYHTLSPDGSRLYFFRDLKRKWPPPEEPARGDDDDDGEVKLPDPGNYVLCCAGLNQSESRIIETGINCQPPLFLPDGRLVVMVRKLDTDGDGEVTELDEHSLVLCQADGTSPYEVDVLAATESVLAVWKGGKEVLVTDFTRHDVNGWINTLPLVRGKKRSQVVKGFNVEMVLPDDRLLIERKQTPAPETQPVANPWARWNRRNDDVDDSAEEPREAMAGLLDANDHIIFNPADGSEVPLYGASQRSHLFITGEGSFFGHQEYVRQANTYYNPWGGGYRRESSLGFELVIVDDKDHRDTKLNQARYDYLALGWLENRGLVAVEHGRLTKHLLLLDRAMKFHELATFDFDARGFVASKDGMTIAYIQVDDTNKNGLLESWLDEGRPHIVKLPK
ncbi:MAG: PD40 domain-containing protein [Planctomycetes bacterium]|nr:PD40 domain-containing protein [Planctomycetota bacterium]